MSIAQLEILTRNRPGPHAEQAGVRYSVLDSAIADFKATLKRLGLLEEQVAACTCQPVPTFDVTAHLRPRREHEVLSTTCARLKELGRTPPTVADILFDERTVL